MSHSVEEEVRQILAMTDPAKVQAKRAGRKGQLTKLDSSVRILMESSLATIRPGELQEKTEEITRSSILFDALQERLEELSLQAASDFPLEEEEAQADTVRSEIRTNLSKAKVLQEKQAMYVSGAVALESLSSMLELDLAAGLNLPAVHSDLESLKFQVTQFRKESLCYQMDMEIHELRSKLTSILKEINARILDEQMKDRAPSSRESFLKPSEIIVKSAPTTKHKVALLKFDGTSLDWK